jgi:hypothetical protein
LFPATPITIKPLTINHRHQPSTQGNARLLSSCHARHHLSPSLCRTTVASLRHPSTTTTTREITQGLTLVEFHPPARQRFSSSLINQHLQHFYNLFE